MFNKISEQQFNSSDPIFRVIIHDYPRKFGSLQLPNASHALTMCWRSDLIDPVIVHDPLSSSVWIGVDQRIACVALTGSILLSMSLNNSLLEIRHFENCTVALCETQALVFNHDYSLRKTCDLKNIAVSADIKDDKLIVTLLDGEIEEYSI